MHYRVHYNPIEDTISYEDARCSGTRSVSTYDYRLHRIEAEIPDISDVELFMARTINGNKPVVVRVPDYEYSYDPVEEYIAAYA